MSATRTAIVIAALAVARARIGTAGSFVVGASVVDITPPLAATASSNPANCDTTGTFDGPHLFSLEGGDGHDRLPTAVLDPITARTIVVGNGTHKISITVADNEGVFREIWELVRQKVRADGGFGLDEMFMSSTHDEAAPDTIGI